MKGRSVGRSGDGGGSKDEEKKGRKALQCKANYSFVLLPLYEMLMYNFSFTSTTTMYKLSFPYLNPSVKEIKAKSLDPIHLIINSEKKSSSSAIYYDIIIIILLFSG
jgi:hypothetical protein